MYAVEIPRSVVKKIGKLKKSNPGLFYRIECKIDEICENPLHYKPLRGDLAGERRVHFGSFVLTFEIDEETKAVRILDYDHHDRIYKKRN